MASNHESLGQEFLVENNLIVRRSSQRAQLLACLACRWSKSPEDPQAYGYQIIQCAGMKGGVVYPLLARLEEAGVTKSTLEDHQVAINDKRPPRKFIAPVDTELGRGFRASLEDPDICALED